MSSWLQKKAPFGESILARFRTSLPVKDEVDITVCLESFQAHWEQAWSRMQAHQNGTTVTMDEVNTVLNHTDQLRVLVCWELEQQQQQQDEPPGRLADLFLSCRVPERLLAWSACCGQFEPLLQTELLRVFEQLLRSGGGALLVQRAMLRPLTDLLLRCRSGPSCELHRRLVLVLSQLCRALHDRPPLLDLFLGLEPDGSASSFVIFSLLVEFVHGEGVVGGTAREALLHCTRLSADSRPLAEFIVQHSDFCEVLATGLSGLYSALPRTPPSDDEELPEVDTFVVSLQFCNSVLQTCHPMIAAVLLELVYQGFLVSVMGPALHQSSVEAVVTATTYLELCVRSVDHPGLVRALVRLLLRHRHEGVTVIDTLVQRIAATPRLAVATLSLLHTLLNLNCEDVLLELVLRYLLPCSHLMASQRSRVTETDLYGAGARRLLSLVPACCQPGAAENPLAAAAAWLQCGREARLALTACRRATRCWTYAYDGADPSAAEAERMARRRRGSAASASVGALEERGEADGEAKRETAPAGTAKTTAAAAAAVAATVGSAVDSVPGSPVVDGWRLGRLQQTVGPEGSPSGTPPSHQPHAAGDQDQALEGGVSGSPPPSRTTGPPAAADGDTSVSSQLFGTPSGPTQPLPPPPPSAAAGLGPDPDLDLDLDLSVGDVWSTPQTSAAARGRDGEWGRVGPRVSEADPDSDSLRLGILSLLPDESSSDTEASLRGAGEPLSLRGTEVLGREEEEEVGRGSGAAEVASIASAEEAAVALEVDDEPPAGDGAAQDVSSAGGCRTAAGGQLSENCQGAGVPDTSPTENQNGTGPVNDVDGTDPSTAVTAGPPSGSDGSEKPAELGKLVPAENGEAAATEREEPSDVTDREGVAAEGRRPIPVEVGEEAVPPSSDLSTFVERHSGTVRAPPPPPPPMSVSVSSVPRPPLPSQQSAASDTATAVPSIGPFLLALLERLDLATTNSLQLNLLLMSVISRLSHYPQPLLRSLLLNPTLVFQPSVRTLIQTLGSLKHRIDLATRSVQDAPGLVRWARSRLEARPAATDAVTAPPDPAGPGLGLTTAATGAAPSLGTSPGTSPDTNSGSASLPAQLSPPAAATTDGDPGGFSLSGLAGRLRRALPAVSLSTETSDQLRRRAREVTRTSVGSGPAEWDASERRVALTAVLLEQWLAELAAVALEHSVLTDRLVFSV